jgi:hypothetical protein
LEERLLLRSDMMEVGDWWLFDFPKLSGGRQGIIVRSMHIMLLYGYSVQSGNLPKSEAKVLGRE